MTKYMTGNTEYDVSARIDKVEVERETADSVWVKGRRRAKITGWDIYHDTWDEAHAHLMREAERHVEQYKLRLQNARSRLDNVFKMRRPE